MTKMMTRCPSYSSLESMLSCDLHLVLCVHRLFRPLLGRVCTCLLLAAVRCRSQLPARMRRQACHPVSGGPRIHSQDKTCCMCPSPFWGEHYDHGQPLVCLYQHDLRLSGRRV